MANELIYGTHKVGFYLAKPHNCKRGGKNNEILGTCRVGFAAIGALYMEGEQAYFESYEGIKLKVSRNNDKDKADLRIGDLAYINNAQSYANTYRRRADFIESKMRELTEMGQFTDASTFIKLPQ